MQTELDNAAEESTDEAVDASPEEKSGEPANKFEDSEDMSPQDRLSGAREAQRLSLSHISAETRIPERHLKSIEAGDFGSLPSRTYAIGFARSFARSVGLDDSSIADAVRIELAGIAQEAAIEEGMEPGDAAKLPSAGLAWFGAIAALILAVGVISFVSSYFAAGEPLPSLVAEEEASEVAEAAVATDAESAGATVAVSTDGEVVFTALESGVWVRFYEDGGERLFEAQMEEGDNFAIPAEAVEPRINTGRPDAFAITIGGASVPKLAEEPVTMGDTPISAEALLARSNPANELE